jgi:putative transposase
MPQSLAQVYLHIVFSTKGRVPSLKDAAIRDALHHYLGGICRKIECPSLRIGGTEDHVHLAIRLGRVISIAELLKELKQDSSKWLKTQSSELRDFHWQNGYGAFSVSPGHVERLIQYIASQMEHHKTESFQDEFRRLLRTYGLEWDERYVWD